MGVELLLNVRSGRADTEMKSEGDIICAKLVGSPWGSDELIYHAVVRLSDDAISNINNADLRNLFQKGIEELEEQRDVDGEPHPVIVLPTAIDIEETLPDNSKRRRLGRQSRWFVDFNLVTPALRAAWRDKTLSVPVADIEAVRINATVRTRPNPPLGAGESAIHREDALRNRSSRR